MLRRDVLKGMAAVNLALQSSPESRARALSADEDARGYQATIPRPPDRLRFFLLFSWLGLLSFTRGITSVAMSSIDRFVSCGSTQSIPA